MSDFTESLEKIEEERLEKLKHANSSSVYLSYPAKATARDVESGTQAVPHYSSAEGADEDDVY
jgi:hypothetical protein